MATHLIQKKGESTWYVRRVVPKDVRHVFEGQATITKTTGTSNKSKALELRYAILAEWQLKIDAARLGKAAELEDTLDLASQAGKSHAVMIGAGISRVLTGSEREDSGLGDIEPFVEKISKAASDGDIPHAAAIAILRMLKEAIELREAHGTPVPVTDQIQLLSAQHGTHLTDVFRAAIESESDLSDSDKSKVMAVYKQPGSYKQRSPITTARLDAFRMHLERRGIEPKTIDQMSKRVKLFSDYLARTGEAVSFDTVSTYLDQLTDTKGVALTAKTKKQHLWSCNTFWKFAVKHDAEWRELYKGLPSPFVDHDLPVIRGESVSWAAFKQPDVERLYKEASAKKDQPLADLIALGAYTGARLEEIGRIHRDTLTVKDGVPTSFHIKEAKSAAGIREVPIHPAIAGLVTNLLEASDDGYLLPGRKLDESNKYGNRLDAVGKRFGRLKTAAQFGKEYVFHSIRKTAITLVHQAGADVSVMPALFGHETGMITFDLYSDGPSLEQKKKVIDLLAYDFE